ncbi:transporter [Paraliobacillus quinghaiensis]|uniref:Transporter n=1 Tax=Paraliobacillus quinghaiensis TaxID=470815 RepID=A0A917WU87_9BACI|nr:RDD family protein [Paraliobacillus quinghaiensis]GGM30284.1 transporter [Paraliobacillus quinghaiensis]
MTEEEQVDIKTPEYVSLQFSVAGLGSRAAALIIDQVVLFVLNALLVLGLFFLVESDLNYMFLATNFEMLLAITIILVFVLNGGYFLVLEFFWGGRTIGKRALGLRTIQDNGHRITLLSSFIRNLLRLIDSLPAGYLVGMLMIFFHPKHKRLGDLAAGTLVVHEKITQHKRKKKTSIEKIISARGLTKDDLIFDSWQLKALDQKGWQLLRTFCQRYEQLPLHEKHQLTNSVATILLPKVGLTFDKHRVTEMENTLFVLYLHVKDEWEYDL